MAGIERTGAPPRAEAAAIIAEEERLLGDTVARLGAPAVEPSGGDLPQHDYDRELIELRDPIAEAKPEDLPPLVEQMTRLSGHRRAPGPLAHAAGRPDVAVLRAHAAPRPRQAHRWRGATRRSRARRAHRQARLHRARRRADRRLAQRAGVADLLPLRGGRRLRRDRGRQPARGRGEARRNVSIARGASAASAARRAPSSATRAATGSRPSGDVRPDAPRRAGEASRPPRPAPVPPRGSRSGSASTPGRCRAPTSSCPRSPRSSTREQFELITAADERPRRHPGRRRLGQDHGRAAPRRVPQLRRPAPLHGEEDAVRRAVARRWRATSPACCRRSACPACRCTPTGTGAQTIRRKLLPRAPTTTPRTRPTRSRASRSTRRCSRSSRRWRRRAAREAADELGREIGGARRGRAVAARFRDSTSKPLVARCRRLLGWLEKQGRARSRRRRASTPTAPCARSGAAPPTSWPRLRAA